MVNAYATLVQEDGISHTLRSMSNTGLGHEWNVIGLDTGTEQKQWYYMDISNKAYLFGYNNPMILSSPEMFSYDASIPENEDGTYTITLTSGASIQLQGGNIVKSADRGDVNQDGITAIDDATAALSIYAKRGASLPVIEYSESQLAAADVDGDGAVTISDATVILTYYAMTAVQLSPDWSEVIG